MLLNWSEHGRLDPRRVGGFGFSSGGLTMLIAAGGVPDISKIRPYCLLHPGEYVCLLLRRAGPTPTATVPADVWTHEVRLKALVIAAPALGFAFAPDGLKTVTVPMQLWRAERDRVLPSPNYVEPVRDALPTPPEYHVAAGADHWDFLAPCSAALAKVAAPICGEIGSFDRVAFHQSFDRDVVAFFTATLKR
jgi:predicted dienelactone hydrolase